ncbi:hypothetical protein GCM10012275_03750 [Longimycelium tulufanense]|uniref:Uncharacterized protein n=1 Tax=Longimycelium tulufanense TaxID=907463 RepID=A0A8J3C7J4_9PSEU|nr:DUF6114 domain-containing protein [Longimycelium tulufanense]GGM35740.1 hypothetical protein GCM10012275_03750 [Longimycelium tulufanense]
MSTDTTRSDAFPVRAWRWFRGWRRTRPFWAGLFLVLSGIVVIAPAYLTLRIGNLLLSISTIAGASSLLIGVLLIVCGLSVWIRPQFRIFAGVAGVVLALVSVVTANLGGFLLGLLLGLLGSALAVSWIDTPKPATPRRRSTNPGGTVDQPAGEHSDTDPPTKPIPIQQPTTEQVVTETILDAGEQSTSPNGKPGQHRPSPGPRIPPTVTVLGVLVTSGAVFLAGSTPPGTATAAPTSSAASESSTPADSASATANPGPTPSSTPSITPTSPSSPSNSTTTTLTPSSEPPTSSLLPSGPPPPTVAADPNLVAVKPVTITAAKLRLTGSVFEGIAELPTVKGTKRALAFRATGIDLTDMVMSSAAGNGRKLVVRSGKGKTATVRGNIRLYTERLKGTLVLGGIIRAPVDFSPDHPPPLVLPNLTFENVTVVNAKQAGGDLDIPDATIAFE